MTLNCLINIEAVMYYEEGDDCPNCKKGAFEFNVKNCSCHRPRGEGYLANIKKIQTSNC